MRLSHVLFAAPLLGLAVPVVAQPAPAPAAAAPAPSAKAAPTCSATVTDHCIQRASRGHAAPMGAGHHGRHHHKGHHKHHRKAS